MDYWINKMDTIQNGYNKQFMLFKDYSVLFSGNGIDKLHKMLFIKIQKNLVDCMEDDTDYKKLVGIIYKITNSLENDKSYIGCAHNKTLKEAINVLYDGVVNRHIQNNSKYTGIDKVLVSVPFTKLKCKIIRTKGKRSSIKLIDHRDSAIKRHNTIKKGYNVSKDTKVGNVYR